MAIEPSWRPPFYSRVIVSREVQAPVFGLGWLCIIYMYTLSAQGVPAVQMVCVKCPLQILMFLRFVWVCRVSCYLGDVTAFASSRDHLLSVRILPTLC